MKHFKLSALFLTLVLVFNACAPEEDENKPDSLNEGSESSPVVLQENTPYSAKIGAFLSGEGKSYYSFTPRQSGSYLFVTSNFSIPQDFNWFVYDDSSYSLSAWISDGLGNNFWDTTPEYTKLDLTAGTTYYAVIQNWDEADVLFTITVVKDDTPASEGTTSAVVLTEGTVHEGKIGKWVTGDDKSYYTFTPASNKTYTITTSGYYVYNNVPVGQNLDIKLYDGTDTLIYSATTSATDSETLTTSTALTAGVPYTIVIQNTTVSKAEIHFDLLVE